MLQQKYRFHGYGSLRFVYQHGKTFRSRMMALRIVANKRRIHGRCSVVVSRKVIKSAVKRNRIRRRVYEIMRVNWNHITPGHDMIITIYDKAVGDVPHTELQTQVVGMLKNAGVWADTPQQIQPDTSTS